MKKIIMIIAAVLAAAVGLTACSSQNNSTADNGGAKGEVSVFYYTFSDAYISSVRSAMDKILKDGGYTYNDYDANGNQTTQTEQVQTAIAKGASMLIVNVVDTGSNDAAQNIVNIAKGHDVPVIFSTAQLTNLLSKAMTSANLSAQITSRQGICRAK